MKCKNCGNDLRAGERFCTNCGTYNDPSEVEEKPSKKKGLTPEDEMEDNSFSEFNEFSPTTNKKSKVKESTDIDYSVKGDPFIAAYIGEDYKWVVERPFNIYALIFSWMYFLYRKLYIIGIVGLVITGIILKFIPIIIVPYIILSMVGSGVLFNKIYLDIIETKVHKLEQKTTSADQLESLCKKKGGVNVFIPLLIFFVFIIIMLLSYINVNIGNDTSKYWSENGTNNANCKAMGKNLYKNLSESVQGGTLEELACEIDLGEKKIYNVYLKLNKEGTYRYLYFQSDTEGFFNLKGNTDFVENLENTEKQYGLTESDKELLIVSKELSNKFSAIKDDSDYEDELINKGKDTKEKTHYVFTRDDIFS